MLFEAGDTISKYKDPFTKYLNGNCKKIRCSYCFKCKDSLPQCSVCKTVLYCHAECQKSDWNIGHSIECKIYRDTSLRETLLRDDALGKVVRLLCSVKLDTRKSNRKRRVGKKPAGLIVNDLQDRFYDIRTAPIVPSEWISFVSNLNRMLLFTSTETTLSSVARYFAIWSKIGVPIWNEDNSAIIGAAMYDLGSSSAHSCRPNAVRLMDSSHRVQIRCIEAIVAVDDPTVSYLTDVRGRSSRRKKLQTWYGFNCECKLCELEKNNAEVNYRSLCDDFNAFNESPFYTDRTVDIAKNIFTKMRKVLSRYDERVTFLYGSVLDKAIMTLDVGRPEFTSKITTRYLKEFVVQGEENYRITFGIGHENYKYFKDEILPKFEHIY